MSSIWIIRGIAIHMERRKNKLISVLGALLVFSLSLVGCSPRKSPSTAVILDPHKVGVFEFSGTVWANQVNALSPDGKHVLLVKTDSEGNHLAVMPVPVNGDSSGQSSGEGPNAQKAEFITVDSVSKDWVQNNIFSYYPLGWLSNEKVIYAVFGWMDDGPHRGKRGLSIRVADIGDTAGDEGEPTEVFFQELPKGYYKDGTFIRDKGSVYFTVTSAAQNGTSCTIVSQFQVDTKSVRVIKGDLPSYDSLFNPRLSPDGNYYVYDIHEQGRTGVYILDTATGEEKPLLPAKGTLSFMPSWSPDGKYVAAYTVKKLPGQNGQNMTDYGIFPGEDGPLPIGEKITVVDVDGHVVKEISVEGKYVSSFIWGKDSKSLGFIAGKERNMGAQSLRGQRDILSESLWVSNLEQSQSPVQLADISSIAEDAYVMPSGMSPDGNGVFFTVYSQEGPSLWYAGNLNTGSGSRDQNPVRVFDGSMELWPVTFGDSLAAVLQGQNTTSLWLLSSGKFTQVEDFNSLGHVAVVGYNRDILVIFKGDVWDNSGKEPQSQIVVYRMTR